MALPFHLDSPIGYAHYRLRGGWKNIALTAAAYGMLLATVIAITVHFNPLSAGGVYAGWVRGILGLQCVMLYFVGGMSLSKALRLDATSRMTESLRLMPVAPAGVVVGYLTGPTCQAIGFGVANAIVCAFCARSAGMRQFAWMMPMVVVVVLAVLMWATIIFSSMTVKAIVGTGLVVMIGGFLGGDGAVRYAVPGPSVLLGPLIGQTIFSPAAPVGVGTLMLYSLAAQATLTGLLLVGACMKYRRAERPLGAGFAIAFLAIFVAISYLGVVHFDELAFTRGWHSGERSLRARAVGSVGAALAVGLIPVVAAARARALYAAQAGVAGEGDPALPRRRPADPLWAMVVMLWPLVSEGESFHADADFWSIAGASGAFLVSSLYFVRLVYRRWAGRGALVLVWATAICMLPVVADLIHQQIVEPDAPQSLGMISSTSPLGTLLIVWEQRDVRLGPGLCLQGGIAVALALIYHASNGGRSKPAGDLIDEGA